MNEKINSVYDKLKRKTLNERTNYTKVSNKFLKSKNELSTDESNKLGQILYKHASRTNKKLRDLGIDPKEDNISPHSEEAKKIIAKIEKDKKYIPPVGKYRINPATGGKEIRNDSGGWEPLPSDHFDESVKLTEAVTYIDNAGRLKTTSAEEYVRSMHEYDINYQIEGVLSKLKKKKRDE